MTAGVVTDVALQLARDLIQEASGDIAPELIELGVHKVVYVMAQQIREAWDDEDNGCDPFLPFSESLADVADWVYLGPRLLLDSFVPVLDSSTVPVYRRPRREREKAKRARLPSPIPSTF